MNNTSQQQSANTSGNAGQEIILDSVGDPETIDSGSVLVPAYFKKGKLGRPIRRAFWGNPDEETGEIEWKRVTPDQLRSMIGEDFSSELEIRVIDIEPKEIVSSRTGEPYTLTSATVIKLHDETLPKAASIYGVTPLPEKPGDDSAREGSGLPAGFSVVGGDGHA